MSTTLRESTSRALGFADTPRAAMVAVLLGISSLAFGVSDLLWLDVGDNAATYTWPSLAMVAVASAAVVFHRRLRIWSVAVCGLGRILVALDAATETPISFASSMVAFAYCRYVSRPLHAIAGIIVTAATAVASVVITAPSSTVVESGIEVVQAAVFGGLGLFLRSNALRNERLIEAEATKRSQAERLQLARDLHDVVAHNLSSIAVQSGVAAQLMDRDPEHARAALESINTAGRDSLDELRAFLGMLRSDDYLIQGSTDPVEPDDIDTLVDEMSKAGLPVDLRTSGAFPSSADQQVLQAAYHIIREALINVARHAGPVATSVELRHSEEILDLRIHNQAGRANRPAVPSTGLGIVGMTEQAAALGGSLITRSPTSGGFEVQASLPYTPADPT